MARRRKSYFAKSNRGKAGSVFINNMIADSQKRSRAADKEREQAAKRAATAKKRAASRAKREAEARRVAENKAFREKERKRRAAEKETERAMKQRAREQKARDKARLERRKEEERQRKAKERELAKVNKIYVRLVLDLEKNGLFPGERTAREISEDAVAASLSPTQAAKYFVVGKEDEVGARCAEDFLVQTLDFEERFTDLTQYQDLLSHVASFRPQTEIETSEVYHELKSAFETEVAETLERERIAAEEKRERERLEEQARLERERREEQERLERERREAQEKKEREQREAERVQLLSELSDSKEMFSDELEDFAELIEREDLSGTQAKERKEYSEYIENKKRYWSSLVDQLQPFVINAPLPSENQPQSE